MVQFLPSLPSVSADWRIRRARYKFYWTLRVSQGWLGAGYKSKYTNFYCRYWRALSTEVQRRWSRGIMHYKSVKYTGVDCKKCDKQKQHCPLGVGLILIFVLLIENYINLRYFFRLSAHITKITITIWYSNINILIWVLQRWYSVISHARCRRHPSPIAMVTSMVTAAHMIYNAGGVEELFQPTPGL